MATHPIDPHLSRRTFLQTSAAAAAPLVLPGRSRALGADTTPLKIGLVGCGGRGTGAANQALHAEDGTVVLTAVADLFQDRIDASLAALAGALGEEHAERLQVKPENQFLGFDAFEKLIATDVDVVLLATPPHFRPAHLAAVIAAGKHVFAEKPFAVDGPGVRSVLETARVAAEKKLALVSGFCWRYNKRHRALFERVHAGAIGDIRAVYSTYNADPNGTRPRKEGWTDMEWQMRNWYNFLWLSGDHITEQACHSLDKMAWAMQDVTPLSVTAIGGRQARTGPESGNIFDHFSATFEYPDDVKGFHMCRQMANCTYDNSDYILGTKGNATINGWVPLHKIDGENAWQYEEGDSDTAGMYQREHDELFASIRAGEPRNDGVWAAHSTMLSIMARMSAYTGQPITWEEALGSEERLGPETYELGPLAMRDVAIPGKTKFS